jgi:hypothetical protein
MIYLPVKKGTDEVNYSDADIDWDYMASHIRELEAYLKEAGLDSYELTDVDEEVLSITPRFGEFKVGDLFESENGDTDLKKTHLNGEGHLVITAGVDSYGVAGNSSVPAKILPANTLTVDMFGNCFYRPFEYKMVTHARVFALIPKRNITAEVGLYLSSSFKWLTNVYSYGHMC